jgi:hypothetical protein
MSSGRRSLFSFISSERWVIPDLTFEVRNEWQKREGMLKFTELEPFADCLPSLPKLNLPPCLSDEERKLASWRAAPVHALGYYELSDVIVQGAGYLWKNGRILSGPEFQQTFVRERLLGNSRLMESGKIRSVKKLKHPALLIVGWDYNKYGHWCMDILPRLSALYRCEPEVLRTSKIVLPADLRPSFWHMLKTAFELDDKQLFRYDPQKEVVRCKTAILPTMIHRDYRYHPSVASFFDDMVRLCRGNLPSIGRSGLLYVSRKRFVEQSGNSRRILSNTAELEDMVDRYGFEKIEPESLPWKEQVALFANARIVIGEHGSAMKNLLFSPEGVCAVVFNFLNATQAVIAAMRRQNYVPIKCDDFRKMNWAKRPYSLDVGKAEECLKWALDSF